MSFRLGDFKQQIDPALLKREPGVRADGRGPAELRPVRFTTGYLKHADGSCLIEVGDTRVVCAVSVEEKVPPFLKGKGEGWVTAEYGMLPRATTTRSQREASKGAPSGRTHEIQRLIGRSLRAVVDPKALGERTLWVDCDVIQADGGTRCASITGAFVALVEALRQLRRAGALAGAAGHRLRRRGVRGQGGRRDPPRPQLRGGLDRPRRHERRQDRAGAASSRCRAPPRGSPSPRTRCGT